MESLNPQDIDSRFDECYMKKRQRNINESEIASSSSTRQWSSDVTDTTPPSILLSTGSGGGTEMAEEAAAMMMETTNSLLSYGSISVMGRRRAMKDAKVVTELDGYQFFAVYDGHGGSSVSNACRDRLHHLLAQEVEPWTRGGSGVVDWEKVMASCFTKMDLEVGGAATVGVGSSAVVVMVGQNEVVVANSGNSRAVLCRGGVAIPLSRDHNPGRPDERERVEAAGGRVIDWHGCRVLGVLATTRSIGDHYLKPYVISQPEVTVSERTKCCDFLVIASDGLWDVVSNETACQVARRSLEAQRKSRISEGVSGSTAAANAAALLAQLALARGSKDNITVIVVELSKSTA